MTRPALTVLPALNLRRAPFLSGALAEIVARPGGPKMRYVGRRLPNRTRAYRYAAINRLIEEGYVENLRADKGGRYALVPTDEGIAAVAELFGS